jgi:hypothetical protein
MAWIVARMGGMRNANKISVGILKGRDHLEDLVEVGSVS